MNVFSSTLLARALGAGVEIIERIRLMSRL